MNEAEKKKEYEEFLNNEACKNNFSIINVDPLLYIYYR